jgi:hypothetical protein
MRTECAVLCDAANVRDGLLHILGAGVTQVAVPELPAQLPITLALRVVEESREIRPGHTVLIELFSYTSQVVASMSLQFLIDPEAPITGEGALAAPIPLHSFTVERAGRYTVKVSLDTTVLAELPLKVEKMAV